MNDKEKDQLIEKAEEKEHDVTMAYVYASPEKMMSIPKEMLCEQEYPYIHAAPNDKDGHFIMAPVYASPEVMSGEMYKIILGKKKRDSFFKRLFKKGNL